MPFNACQTNTQQHTTNTPTTRSLEQQGASRMMPKKFSATQRHTTNHTRPHSTHPPPHTAGTQMRFAGRMLASTINLANNKKPTSATPPTVMHRPDASGPNSVSTTPTQPPPDVPHPPSKHQEGSTSPAAPRRAQHHRRFHYPNTTNTPTGRSPAAGPHTKVQAGVCSLERR